MPGTRKKTQKTILWFYPYKITSYQGREQCNDQEFKTKSPWETNAYFVNPLSINKGRQQHKKEGNSSQKTNLTGESWRDRKSNYDYIIHTQKKYELKKETPNHKFYLLVHQQRLIVLSKLHLFATSTSCSIKLSEVKIHALWYTRQIGQEGIQYCSLHTSSLITYFFAKSTFSWEETTC